MLLVYLANVRLDWKVIASYKHSSLFGLVISNEEKRFYNIDTWAIDQGSDIVRVFPDLEHRRMIVAWNKVNS